MIILYRLTISCVFFFLTASCGKPVNVGTPPSRVCDEEPVRRQNRHRRKFSVMHMYSESVRTSSSISIPPAASAPLYFIPVWRRASPKITNEFKWFNTRERTGTLRSGQQFDNGKPAIRRVQLQLYESSTCKVFRKVESPCDMVTYDRLHCHDC